jgi:hypothetical protein
MASIEEKFVVYFSKDDDCWLAHGLRTDEIGTGDCVVDAVADFIKAIDQIARLAEREGDIEIFRDAPKDIQRMAKTAKPLPEEIYEIAHRRARGDWPRDFHVDTARTKRYTARIQEAIAAK